MLLGTLGVRLLGDMLEGKGINRAGYGSKDFQSKGGKRIIRVGYGSKLDFKIPPHPLSNFEVQKYYQNEPRFNGDYSRDSLPKKNRGWGICNKSW